MQTTEEEVVYQYTPNGFNRVSVATACSEDASLSKVHATNELEELEARPLTVVDDKQGDDANEYSD